MNQPAALGRPPASSRRPSFYPSPDGHSRGTMTRPLILLALLLPAGAAVAEDWPRWRGPRGDGTWQAPPLPERWPAGGPRCLWRQPVGAGYAGLSVADGRLVTLDFRDGTEGVVCRNAAT